MTHDEALSITAAKLEKLEDILLILKPLCEVYETPKRHDLFLKVSGVVVYQFKQREEYNLFKEWLDNEKIKRA